MFDHGRLFKSDLRGGNVERPERVLRGAAEKQGRAQKNDIETHLHDLLLSKNAKAYSQFEHKNYVTRLTSLLEQPATRRVDCVADVLADAFRRVQARTPREFCAVERQRLVKMCVAAINTSAASLFKNKHFKICRTNQKAIVFGLVYLLHTGVTNNAQVVLPRLPELCAVLPLENHLKSFFGVSPSSITDTQNRLKYVVRHTAPDKSGLSLP